MLHFLHEIGEPSLSMFTRESIENSFQHNNEDCIGDENTREV